MTGGSPARHSRFANYYPLDFRWFFTFWAAVASSVPVLADEGSETESLSEPVRETATEPVSSSERPTLFFLASRDPAALDWNQQLLNELVLILDLWKVTSLKLATEDSASLPCGQPAFRGDRFYNRAKQS